MYIGSLWLERRVVQTIGAVTLADATKRMPRVPIWASETTIRVDCDEVIRVQDGIPHRRVTYWEVYVGTSPPKKLRRLGEETLVGDSLWQETDFHRNGKRARRCSCRRALRSRALDAARAADEHRVDAGTAVAGGARVRVHACRAARSTGSSDEPRG